MQIKGSKESLAVHFSQLFGGGLAVVIRQVEIENQTHNRRGGNDRACGFQSR
jgi:hypothetical protein